jgi:hypothetical protein
MSEKKIQLPLRLDPELHDRLRRAANRERRSVNLLVTMIIEGWLDQYERQDQ